MKTFDSIQKALEYTVGALIPQDHTYIINIVGPKETAENRAATVQVVAQHMVYGDRTFGLTLNLPFDPSSGEFAHLVEFMGSPLNELCEEYEFDGIPCFALRFGTDVDVATKALTFILSEIYGYDEATTFHCEVHDEGVVEKNTQTSEPTARFSAKHFGYYDDWKNDILTCPKCGWSGTFMQGSVGHYRELMDSSCPVCDYGETPMLAIVSYPTLEETEANFDRLSEQEKAELAQRKQFVSSFESSCLKTLDQLPDLSEAQITLSWDFSGEEAGDAQTVIRHGDQVVWSEPAIWEGYERFEEIIAMLKQKYGERLVDVVPTTASELYLYGDRLSASGFVEKVRLTIRADSTNQQCRCMEPQCSFDAFDKTDIGVDETKGRFGSVDSYHCKHCGRYWLHYHVEYEAFSRSGRWYRGLITREQATSVTPENAVALLDSLPWHFYGGSYFDTPGKKGSGPVRVDL